MIAPRRPSNRTRGARQAALRPVMHLACALLWGAACGTLQAEPQAEPFDIAITVDDLPVHGELPPGMTRVGLAREHLRILKAHGVPQAYGFVNAGQLAREPDSVAVLDLWRQAGHPLANHGYRHLNLDRAPSLEAWQSDVVLGEAAVAARMAGADWHYFRYPELAGGDDAAKREGALRFLQQRGYRVADVSVGFSEWLYNAPYARCMAAGDNATVAAMRNQFLAEVERGIARMKTQARQLYGRVVPQVLLTHIGAWNAATMDAVLTRLEAAGARYVTLAQAQQDPAYADPGGGMLMQRAADKAGVQLLAVAVDGPGLELQGLCR